VLYFQTFVGETEFKYNKHYVGFIEMTSFREIFDTKIV